MDGSSEGKRGKPFTPEEIAEREESARRAERADRAYLKARKALWRYICGMIGRNAETLNVTSLPDNAELVKWISEIMGKAVKLIDTEALYKLIQLEGRQNPPPLDAQGFVQAEISATDDHQVEPAAQEPKSFLMRQPASAEEFYLQVRLQSLCRERGVWLPIEVMNRIGDVCLDAFPPIDNLILDFMERAVIEEGARKSAEAAGVPFDQAYLDAWDITRDVAKTVARIGRGLKQYGVTGRAA